MTAQTQISRTQLVDWCNQLLQPHLFHDYCPNGLQLQGKDTIRKVVTGVTASLDLIEHAINANADALFVHHGWFWKNEPPSITGIKHQRIQTAMNAGLNILAYHLPLDAHPLYGNNAQLAKLFDFIPDVDSNQLPQGFGRDKLIMRGKLSQPMRLSQLGQYIGDKLARQPLVLGPQNKVINTIAWCSGGAQGFFEEAMSLGVDAYLTGEVSEFNFHLANEYQAGFIAAGHHASERYGAKAVGEVLSAQLGIEVEFIDLYNPA